MASALGLSGIWKADPMLSSVTFSVRHMGVRMFRAGFRDIEATFDGDSGMLIGRVPLTSVDIKMPDIRARVLSAEFLDAGRFPDVTFSAAQLRREDGREVVVPGELTVHGTTCLVEARGRMGEPGPGFGGAGDHLPLELSATIDRRDFGLDGQEELPDGGPMLAYEVTLEAVLDLVQAS